MSPSTADVLVIGGGPAATWAAVSAAEAGARVVLVDKGYCGTSGVAAAAGVTHWWVAPERRDAVIERTDELGGGLSERPWMHRVLAETWRRWPEVAGPRGYPADGFFREVLGDQLLVQGPVYLREMRGRVRRAGVRILDHAPALELLRDPDGAVCGAAGVLRQRGGSWRIAAGAVVLATGGCAFRSGALGSHVDTGDGYLMAAEVGAALSGMEFSNHYGLVPAGTAMDKNGYFRTATFTDSAGDEVADGWDTDPAAAGSAGMRRLVEAAARGPLYAVLDRTTDEDRRVLRAYMPGFFLVFDRLGVDPFTSRFRVEFLAEGTVRGTGGVRVVDDTCWTGVPGLWVAGDAASREHLVGASTGAGAPNSSWAIASGTWAGAAAAAHAHGRTAAPGSGAGLAGLRPLTRPDPDAPRQVVAAVQAEFLPAEPNVFRTAERLGAASDRLDALWTTVRTDLGGDGREAVAAREAAALVATGRWAVRSALARTESRGMHLRTDRPDTDPALRGRFLVSGVDDPAVTFRALRP